jgi:hypothetical protein
VFGNLSTVLEKYFFCVEIKVVLNTVSVLPSAVDDNLKNRVTFQLFCSREHVV